jgi:hypothetical protein
MQKNDRFIVNLDILPRTNYGVDWDNVYEIEVYFMDDEKTYILKVEDIIKDKNIKILLSYNGIKYKRYLQSGQMLNGNLQQIFNYFEIRGNKLRAYKKSEDDTYWIGTTVNDEEFYFNGEHSEEIMKYNWHISNGYIVGKIKNSKYIRLNRMVLNVTDRNIVVNHRGGNKMDNRVEMLSLSDHEDNMKELLPSINNNTGITGLSYNENNNKYNISCSVNGFSYCRTYDRKDESLIDLLIIQRNYGYRHNEGLYYMLVNISEDYINELINQVEESISKRKTNPIINKNRFELSEDGSFYYMYDKNDRRCKVSVKDLELVKQGNWRYVLNNGKEYFSGEIIWNGKRKGIFLHRFLFDLTDTKYRHWYIDHLNGDGINNTRDNLVITDAEGNGLNKKREKIEVCSNNKFQSSIKSNGKYYYKRCDTYDETVKWRDETIKMLLNKRLQFKSKDELDNYINSKNLIINS